MARGDARIALLLELLDSAFGARCWNGANLRGSLRGVSPALALWRPGPGRPRIWDYLLHCAYWKHTVRRRLSAAEIGAFARPPANFPQLPVGLTAAAWRADIRLLEDEHRALRRLVEGMSPARLDRQPKGARWRNIEQIHGVAAHDCYHTGQIQLIKRLATSRSTRS